MSTTLLTRASITGFIFATLAACGGGTPRNLGADAAVDATIDAESSADASLETDAGTDAGLGAPIVAPARRWTWVPFANAFCGNGSTTGIGVNLSTTSSRVLIYVEGGGACWNDLTCYSLMSAAHFNTGYNEATFTTEATSALYLAEPGGFFDRNAVSNPFKDYSYVYIPYCTGDLHAGNNVVTYAHGTAHFVGFANMSAYLARIVPTFPTPDRVVLAGSSAGGYGALLNFWQTQQKFGSTRVDLIDDSGPFMPPDISSLGVGEDAFRTQWNLASTLPSSCTACSTRLDALFGFYAEQFPTHRIALLSYIQDSVLPTYFGITTANFESGLADDISAYFTPNPNLHYFTNPGSGHVLLFNPSLTTNHVTVKQFVTQMVTDEPGWTSVF